MRKYQIMIGPYPQHIVMAEDVTSAVSKWVNENGYDSLDQAASEYDLQGSDITAVRI